MEANRLREIAGTILQRYPKGYKQTTWTFKDGKKYKIEISVTPCEEGATDETTD